MIPLSKTPSVVKPRGIQAYNFNFIYIYIYKVRVLDKPDVGNSISF